MAIANVLVSGPVGREGKSISRRGFIESLILVAAGGALLVAGSGVRSAGTGLSVPEVALRRSLFAARLGETFSVQVGPSGWLALQLAVVRGLGPAPRTTTATDANDDQSFLIQFSGPRDQPLEQQIYRFEHSAIGAFVLFIVPMAAAPEARYYEAIFNRQAG